jgi:hypothetical protein
LTPNISASGAIMLMITFGYHVQKHNDPFVKIAEDAVDTFSRAALPAAFLVDFFPIRTDEHTLYVIQDTDQRKIVRYVPAWFPGAGFKRTATLWREKTMKLVNLPYEMVKSDMVRLTSLIHWS